MDFNQLGIFFLQTTLVSGLILTLFRVRKTMGLGMVYICLGLFQFIQVFLPTNFYMRITGVLAVSFASVVFTTVLFTMLLVYIKEDANETKKVIYALLLSNLVIALTLLILNFNLDSQNYTNPYVISMIESPLKFKILLLGTLVLLADMIFAIFLYEFISKYINKLFFRIFLTMVLVLAFDSFVFNLITFWDRDNLSELISSSIIAKVFTATFLSFLYTIYLAYFEKDNKAEELLKIQDIFQKLSYKQKFELASKDIIKTSTELQIKEDRYKTLTDTAPVGVFHTTPTGETTYVNPKWCEITGISAEDAFKDGWKNYIHPDDVDRISHCWNEAVNKKMSSSAAYRFIRKDGTLRWVLGNAVPELNKKNEIIGFIGTTTDITEIKKYQEQLIQLKNKAEEANRLKSAFLANVSHEIRTPMNGILGFTNLLKNQQLTSDDRLEYLDIIEDSGRRMLHIMNDIINISRIEAGSVELHKETFDLLNLLTYNLDFFTPIAQKKNLELIYEKNKPDHPIIMHTDKDKVCSIVSNFITNAIKYTDKGSVTFGYQLQKDNVQLYVKDTGIGIVPEKHQVIFERFIQADIEDRMAREGAGLGLAISKSYAELVNGKISMESKPGVGSIFYLTLPYDPKLTLHNQIVNNESKP